MFKTCPFGTKAREQSDMEDLEVLGSISFDLGVAKEAPIKQAFISLVDKLGTPEFLAEYRELHRFLLSTAQKQAVREILDLEDVEGVHELAGSGAEEAPEQAPSFFLQEISISEPDGKS